MDGGLFQSILNWASERTGFNKIDWSLEGFNEAYGGGRWQDRLKPQHGAMDWLNSSKWYNQLGGREFDEAWGGGNWYKKRLGGEEFDKAWGGGAWLDDRLGFSQFDTDDPEEPEIDDVDIDDVDIPTDDTPIDDGLDDTDNDNDDDDDTKKEVTLTDPDIDSEELSPMAGDVQMSSYLASRRRQLRNKKGRTDTMLTRGAYLQDTDNRMMLS